MNQNITLRLNGDLLKKCRHAAVESNMSLSGWVAMKLAEIVERNDAVYRARERAVSRVKDGGFHLGGAPLAREDIYESR